MAIVDGKYEIPDFSGENSEELRGLWLMREKLTEQLNNHKDRWLTVFNDEGKDRVFDCKMGEGILVRRIKDWIGNSSKSKDYLNEILEEARKRRAFFQAQYIQKTAQLTRRINIIMGSRGEIGILDLKELEIIELFGKFWTVEEVQKYLKNKWGYEMPLLHLRRWYKNKEHIIEKLKNEYLKKNREFRIATETGRLEILNDQLGYWQQLFDSKSTENTAKMILSILEQARREVKGNELSINVDGKIDINATIQGASNILDISKKLPINMLIIALVAAKQGIDPTVIMASLASSYYSKHTGFAGNVDLDAIPSRPTELIRNYNWGELEQKYRAIKQANNKPITDVIEIKDEHELKQAKHTKDELLKSLKNIGNQLNQ